MNRFELLTKLKNDLIFFFDELIELLPQEPDLVIVRIFLKDKIPIGDVMDYVSNKLVPLKNMVLTKNDEFFINNNILFERVDGNKVNHFKRLWTSDLLDTQNKNIVWRWFHNFIVIAEKYNKCNE